MLLTTTISGTIVFPDGTFPHDGSELRFAISGYETDAATVIPETVSVPLGVSGAFSCPIWPNARGGRGSYYTVTLSLKFPSGKSKNVTLGKIIIPDEGNVTLEDLLASYTTEPIQQVGTNISQGARTEATVVVISSNGQNATLDAATAEFAGVMSAADKTKLDQIDPGASGGRCFCKS